MTLILDTRQQAARDWFEALRTRICEAFEAIEIAVRGIAGRAHRAAAPGAQVA